jgi:PIN domain nuclease of toxin-antitoxin system
VRLLLDSHTLLWAADAPARLSSPAIAVLQSSSNDLLLSAATIWEIAIKVGQGKLRLSVPYGQWMDRAISDLGLIVLPINVQYGDVLTRLPFHHRDPFDRLLVAQAQVENVSIISGDSVLDLYGISRVW